MPGKTLKLPVKFIWIFLVVAMGLGLTWEFHPLADASARLRGLGFRTANVECTDIALAPAEQINFKGTTVLKRVAMVGKECVVLIVVDGTRNRHAIHDPIFCFRGAGWEVVGQKPLPLSKGQGSLVQLHRGRGWAQAVYWFSDTETQFASPITFWWKTALRRLSLGRSGQEPVLVVLTSTSGAPVDWPALIRAWPALQAL